MKLLPPDVRRGEALGHLWYLAFLLLQPVLGSNSRQEWLVIVLSIVVFVPLYLRSFWERGRLGLALTFAIAGLGLTVMPMNSGGGTFLIFAAAMCSSRMPPRSALFCHLGLVASTLILTMLVSLPVWTWAVAVVGIVAVGGATIRTAEGLRYRATLLRAQEEVEQMAALAERERIGRDLHDVLGHTLSVVALKSELASKLAESDPQRAVQEIRDVERVARQALSDVRSAVEGYQKRGLSAEVHAAREALAAANVAFDIDEVHVPLSARQETALALTLREAVTNIVRHSGATRCRARFDLDEEVLTFTIEDDGRGGIPAGGSGLDGMRRRIDQVGGRLDIDGRDGMRLTVTMPKGALLTS
jgi:two-component system sensor histidine kinase DesK